MNCICWSADLSVGVTLIDEQHKALIERLGDVAAAVQALEGEREIIRTLGFLTDNTKFHFSAEEEHMAGAGYPALPEQQASHAKFTATLTELVRDFEEEGSTRLLAEAIETFLSRWLENHIRGMDSRFGTFLDTRDQGDA